MALKVVPAGDERCDIHNRRKSPTHICETCLKEYGIDPARPATARPRPRRVRARRAFRRWRSRTDRKVLIGGGVGFLIVGVIVVTVLVAGSGGGGGEGGSGAPLEADVVNALDLVPNLTGGGWVTSDGACAVVSIQFGKDVQVGNRAIEATNADGTVGAFVLPNDPAISEADCLARVSCRLRAHF